ncbi:flagellar hook-basal body complex protein FliE [Paucimonas lemoignei]|uniref:Flagellar hook-basal body complex protein FliE n=1 Tax=Paucimonas lemoignei TaxID=29443 RepID=A0A4V2UIW7_PAULE|nr:flagellar hook-basal body complex protein FliE [Paucimonas lemoignei]TCS37720.1 flagellar hook-basal body complex protein FliE [Paucimonas lemoignei]
MSIPAIEFIPAGISLEQLAQAGQQAVNQPFSNWLQNQVTELNGVIAKSDELATRLATGDTENLHQIMIGMEEAKLAFQLAVQVRNRVIEAYQDVLRMQM